MAAKPTIERLTIRNYPVLRDVTFDKLTPLTVLFGPNGSGKSTVFDVFAFLHEAFTANLRRAWDARNRISEIRSRGSSGPVEFEIKYREPTTRRLITYKLAIDEDHGSPIVVEELLQWTTAPKQGRPREILRFSRGAGEVSDDRSGTKVVAQFVSDGTLKLLAYLTILNDPDPAPVIGIEEPENQPHPRLLYGLAERARAAAERSQVLVTTHSPYFADGLQPEEMWALYRAEDGFTRNVRASDIRSLMAMFHAGGSLDSLWMEGYFDLGDPLTRSGRPQ